MGNLSEVGLNHKVDMPAGISPEFCPTFASPLMLGHTGVGPESVGEALALRWFETHPGRVPSLDDVADSVQMLF
jgi:hypothetical protein